jgi:hypothetical protein
LSSSFTGKNCSAMKSLTAGSGYVTASNAAHPAQGSLAKSAKMKRRARRARSNAVWRLFSQKIMLFVLLFEEI